MPSVLLNAACGVTDSDESYAADLRRELFDLWGNVLKRRAPHVAEWAHSDTEHVIPAGPGAVPYLQALNIWFQLLRIVEENAAIRDRRHVETQSGAETVPSSFAQALAREDLTRERFAEISQNLSVGPTLTAHPTEAKRVTVLEMEDRPAYHTTGRSAATFILNYGNAVLRALNAASEETLRHGGDVAEEGFLTPRGVLQVQEPGQDAAFEHRGLVAYGVEQGDERVQLNPAQPHLNLGLFLVRAAEQ